MRLSKYLSRKKINAKPSSKFSKFFLEASDDDKRKIMEEAARRANEDQRKIYNQGSAASSKAGN